MGIFPGLRPACRALILAQQHQAVPALQQATWGKGVCVIHHFVPRAPRRPGTQRGYVGYVVLPTGALPLFEEVWGLFFQKWLQFLSQQLWYALVVTHLELEDELYFLKRWDPDNQSGERELV